MELNHIVGGGPYSSKITSSSSSQLDFLQEMARTLLVINRNEDL